MTTRSRKNYAEDTLQRSLVQWLVIALLPPPDGPFWTAIDAQIRLPREQARRLGAAKKAMGVRAGVLDMLFIWTRTFFVEVKRPSGGSLSEDQREVRKDLKMLGVPVYVVRSIEQLHDVLVHEGVPLKRTVFMTDDRQGQFNAVRRDASIPKPNRR